MAEIILIQPYTGSWDEMSVRFPESLLAVAAVPVAKGYDVKIIDQRVSSNFYRELNDSVGSETVIFGVTAITGEQIQFAIDVTKYLKKTFPNIPVCWGGVHMTLLPEQTMDYPLIDYGIVGDGDYVFNKLFERLRDNKPVDDLGGLIYKNEFNDVKSNVGQLNVRETKKGNKYNRENGATDILTDLDLLPPLPYDLVDIGKYRVFNNRSMNSATLNTSRGCYWRCKFCSSPVVSEGIWRGLSAKHVLEKVDELYHKYQIRMIYFQDDYFPGPKKRFIEILEGLSKYKRKLMWSTLGVRADTLSQFSDDEWDLLYDSGCHSLDIGIESGNERIIKLMNKAETLEQMRSANKKLADYDFKVKYSFIIGFPGETEDEISDTMNFAAELENTNPNCYTLIFTFRPIIGTAFYAESLQQGFPEPKSLEEWASMDFDNWGKSYCEYWVTQKLAKRLRAINFVSYFHNKNVKYKFGGSKLLRFAFNIYHPIARFRFKHNFYNYCFEVHFKDLVLSAKNIIRKFRDDSRKFRDDSRKVKLSITANKTLTKTPFEYRARP